MTIDFHEWRERKGESADPETERLATIALGAAFEVHTALGPGHPEKVYEEALCHELTLRQIPFTRQARVFLRYKGKEVGESCVHILVGDRVVLELKSIERFTDVHVSQALAYLAALKLRLALLINFNVAHLKQGIKRAIRDL